MRNWLSLIRKIFGFTETEAKGFILLSLMMLIFISIPFLYSYVAVREVYNTPAHFHSLDSVLYSIKKSAPSEIHKNPAQIRRASDAALFEFDPNTAPGEELLRLGFSKKLVRTLLNFRNRGGRFKVKTDLQKIYGLPNSFFEKLQKYIALPDSLQKGKYEKKYFPKIVAREDINTADTAALLKLRGIGSALSRRIVRYRDALGGFIDSTQFTEVYGLDSFSLAELNKHFLVRSDFIPDALLINTLNVDTLSMHPYLGKKAASTLVNFRTQHGGIKSYEDFCKIIGIPESKKSKLKPYLKY